MKKTVRIKTTAHSCSNGHVHIRTTVNNGHTQKTTSKTIRVK